jgi:hypothetical protein
MQIMLSLGISFLIAGFIDLIVGKFFENLRSINPIDFFIIGTMFVTGGWAFGF